VEEGHIQLVKVLDQNCNAYLLDSAENNRSNNYDNARRSSGNFNPLVAAVKQDTPKVLKLVIDIIKSEKI
jgi:hypothetical protein